MLSRKYRSAPVSRGSTPAAKKARRYELTLYVTGATERSLRAIANIKAICDEYLKGLYRLEVVDIYRRPEIGRQDQIVAVPTLIKKAPLPVRLLVGDLSRAEQVLSGLGIAPRTA